MQRQNSVADARSWIVGMRAQTAARLQGASGLERRALEALDERAAAADLEALANAVFPQNTSDHVFAKKYGAVVQHVIAATRVVRGLGLDGREPMDIVDLGAGGGFFCFVVQVCGHRAVALEPAVQAAVGTRHARIDFAPLIQFLGVPHSAQPILPSRPLKRDAALREGQRFDLITAFAIMFNRGSAVFESDASGTWAMADYTAFLDDLRKNFLKPDGRVFLRFNERLDGTDRRAGLGNSPADKKRTNRIEHHAEVGRLLAPLVLEGRGDFGVELDLFRAA